MRAGTIVRSAVVGMFLCIVARGAINVPGDGSDGVLDCGVLAGNPDFNCFLSCTPNTRCTFTIDLGRALIGAWDLPIPSGSEGRGVYDKDKWAVVFKYTSVNIPNYVTVLFKNHPSGAPVVWLVQGAVILPNDSTISLDGENGVGGSLTYAQPGPGGFAGGRRYSSNESHGSGGLGPGGGAYSEVFTGAAPGSYGTQGNSDSNIPRSDTYGNAQILPLIGGSGGSGFNQNAGVSGGGAGGGAILIASRTTIRVNGQLRANGGSASHVGGSGGAIRLIADRVEGAGTLRAVGPDPSRVAGEGRTRIEANINAMVDGGDPLHTIGLPGNPPVIWPPNDAPTLSLRTIGGANIPADPRPGVSLPADVTIVHQDAAKLFIDATNMPITSTVEVHVVPTSGESQKYLATLVSGNNAASVWCAILELRNGVSAVQVRAILP